MSICQNFRECRAGTPKWFVRSSWLVWDSAPTSFRRASAYLRGVTLQQIDVAIHRRVASNGPDCAMMI